MNSGVLYFLSGKWVAVTAHLQVLGDSTAEAEEMLKRKGLTWNDVYLMKVPRKDEEMSILSLNMLQGTVAV